MYKLTHILIFLFPYLAVAQNQTINGNMNVTGYTFSTKGLGLATTTAMNTYAGRKWWTKDNTFNYTEFVESSFSGVAAFIFNGYATQDAGGIDAPGNVLYATNVGSYASGAGLLKYSGNGGGFVFKVSDASTGKGTPVVWNNLLSLNRNQSAIFYGNVGIGMTAPAEKLAVNGNIRAKEVKVETANWPDYVFEDNYRLPDLDETARYIKNHKRLPGMPSARQVNENGISLGEMNRKLLEKVEELTLQFIELYEKYDKLNSGKAK